MICNIEWCSQQLSEYELWEAEEKKRLYNETKLPRKIKKDFKKIFPFKFSRNSYYTASDIEIYLRKLKKHRKYIHKYISAINFILNIKDAYCEPFTWDVIDDEIELLWEWEDDNGLYTTNGEMKFIYEKEKEDETWSYSETMNMLDYLKIDVKITSCKDLLKWVKNNKLKKKIK